MTSKSKEHFLADKRMETGGEVQLRSSSVGPLGSRNSSVAGLNSGGESSGTSSDEDLGRVLGQEYVVKKVVHCQADAMEFSPALGRPDRDTTIRDIPGTSLENFVVRVSKTANHILVMGSPSMVSYPLRCPFKEKRCKSFRACAPQYLKEHLEEKHNLENVQVNLACPCPAVCNVVNGQPRECHSVKYDPMNGVLEGHIQRDHWHYWETMGRSLCIRHEKEENLWDVPEEVKNYVQYLKIPKTLPAWTRGDPKHSPLFPSQIFPDKVMLQTVVKDKTIQYKCPIPPCRADQEMGRHAMSMHLRHEPGHRERMGYGSRIFEHCQECDYNAHWSGKQMMLHVRAMHPALLGEPSNFTEAAKTELANLVGQINGKVIGRAIGDRAGTKAHCLYSFRCHMQNCKEVFSKREHLEWHIMADHHQEWNKSGTSD